MWFRFPWNFSSVVSMSMSGFYVETKKNPQWSKRENLESGSLEHLKGIVNHLGNSGDSGEWCTVLVQYIRS